MSIFFSKHTYILKILVFFLEFLNSAQYLNCLWGEISIPHKLGFQEISPPQSFLPSSMLILNLILINLFIIFFILLVIYSVWQNNDNKNNKFSYAFLRLLFYIAPSVISDDRFAFASLKDIHADFFLLFFSTFLIFLPSTSIFFRSLSRRPMSFLIPKKQSNYQQSLVK